MARKPFLWGSGGRRMGMDEIAMQRRLGAQMQSAGADYSPVGHWTQGLARVGNAITGTVLSNRADSAEAANRDAQSEILANLFSDYDPASGEPDPVVAAMLDEELRPLAMKMWEARQPQAVEPVIKQRNDGSFIGLHPVTGEIMFEQADPNPKPVLDWLISTDPVTGERSLIPVGPDGPLMGGGGPVSGAAPGATPPATLPPDFDFGEEGGVGASRVGANFLDGL